MLPCQQFFLVNWRSEHEDEKKRKKEGKGRMEKREKKMLHSMGIEPRTSRMIGQSSNPPVTGKFMVGKVSQFTLQPMANTNHKFSMIGGPAMRILCEVYFQISIIIHIN